MKKQNLTQRKNKGQKGITLIALIITIIVLLILAVVAIREVQGDGILAKARKARDDYQEAQTNEEGTLQNYTTYIAEQSGNAPTPGGSTSKDTGELGEAVDPDSYGKKVNFTSKGEGLDTLTWRIFYKDANNVYLISEKVNEDGSKDYPVPAFAFYDYNSGTYTKKEIVEKYNSGEDVSPQGQNLMPKAKETGDVFVAGNTNYNIVATAYMCDIDVWDKYTDAEGKAAWAMGGPTMELFVKSYDATQGKTTTLNVSNKGYENPLSSADTFTQQMNNGIYRLKSSGWWWLASPCSYSSSDVREVYDDFGYIYYNGVKISFYARPIVCIPVSNFNGFTVEDN